MRPLKLVMSVALLVILTVSSGPFALADAPPGEAVDVLCDGGTPVCLANASSLQKSTGGTIVVTEGKASRRRTVSRTRSMLQNLCVTNKLVPQPPKTDPIWKGQSSGVVYRRACPLSKDRLPTSTIFWAPQAPAGQVVTVDPSVLAEQARSELRPPSPVLARSPQGRTWVNEYTWFWLKSDWSALTATARAGSAWATVTATPKELKVNAGKRGDGVRCRGRGRAWRLADGAGAPTRGGCALAFQRAGALSLQVSVPYQVSWVGSGGSGGNLGVLTATGQDAVTVLEADAVSRS